MKTKLGGVDRTGVPLVASAFSEKPPLPTEPRLRFRGYAEGTKAWTNENKGAMHFGIGCMKRIRNLLEHHPEEVSEQVGQDCLGALSLLARWIDDAEVVLA